MAIAPKPQYISYEENILPLIGTDKILVVDGNSTAIPYAEADTLIAFGESIALQDLSPYYQTVPTLATIDGRAWTELPSHTYAVVCAMMTYQASLQLVGAFIAKNTDEEGQSLSYFQKYFTSEYNKILNRISDLLPNGSYRYQLIGLRALTA